MNLSLLALALIAFQVLGNAQNANREKKKPDLTEFLSDDTKSILNCVDKLSAKNSDDKLGAIIQMLSNPAVMNLAQTFFSPQSFGNSSKPQGDKQEQTFTNDEGYAFDTPSPVAKEFFKPIEHIADPEVKNKLYSFYDNWYVK